MVHEFSQRRVIEFAETDMAGIVHFSNFFRYMEACEHAFFRSQGLSLHRQEGEEMVGFARVRAECQYLAPLHYQDEVDVRLIVREKRASALTYEFQFTRDPLGASPVLAAKGAMTVVCVRGRPGVERMRAAPLPADVQERIAPAQTVLDQEG